MLEIQQSAEPFYNPDASQKPAIDPDTVIDHQARRLRLSGRFSVQVGERTTNKSLARMHEWRNTIIATERKRLRKTVLDLLVSLPLLLSRFRALNGMYAGGKTTVKYHASLIGLTL